MTYRTFFTLTAFAAWLPIAAAGQTPSAATPPFDEAAARAEAQHLGIPDEALNEYVEALRRRAVELRAPSLGPSPGPPILPLFPPSGCQNGGFEGSSLAPWAGDTGSVLSCQKPTAWLPGLVNLPGNPASRHWLMPDSAWGTSGLDPILLPHSVALPVTPSNGGLHSLRLGNAQSGGETERLRQTFTVTTSTTTLRFRYALVLQDPGSSHPTACKPAFTARALDSSGNTIHSLFRVANLGDPFFQPLPNAGLVHRRWSCHSFDLSQYLGQVVTIEFTTADCGYGGHYGYAYIDGVCESDFNQPIFTSASEVCGNGPIVVDGSATEGEVAHFWSVEESDVNGGRPNPSSEVSEWFQGQAGSFDLKAWYASKGRTFECGKYYRVKLAITTECSPWTETVKVIHIRCPKADAGPDKAVCCCGPKKLQIGTAAETGTQYSWSPATGLDDAHLSNPTIDYGQDPNAAYPSLYELTATDSYGCTAKDSVLIKTVCGCRPPAKVTAKRTSICSRTWTLTADCACGDATPSYEWNPGGATSASIEVLPSDVPYTVTCRNECGATVSAPILAGPLKTLDGPFPPIQCPNIFTPNGDGVNDLWVVIDQSQPPSFPTAYNATEYELKVFNRWGRVVAIRYGSSATGFANGSIPGWDGVATHSALYNWWQHLWGYKDTHAGKPVSDGVYYFILRMRNCTTPWTDICVGFTHVAR